jgi:hypothetical protein
MMATQQPPARKTNGFAIAACVLVVLVPLTPARYFAGSFGFRLFVVLGTVYGLLACVRSSRAGKRASH